MFRSMRFRRVEESRPIVERSSSEFVNYQVEPEFELEFSAAAKTYVNGMILKIKRTEDFAVLPLYTFLSRYLS